MNQMKDVINPDYQTEMNSRERVVNILQRRQLTGSRGYMAYTRGGRCVEKLYSIQAGTPVENIITMIETVKNWCP